MHISVTEESASSSWKQMLELWNGKLCNELANEYLMKNIMALSELFSGEINATHILFPEGKFDYANALYKDTFIFKYLNSLILEEVQRTEQISENIDILEIGAGTGSTTDTLLPLIEKNEKISYYFTDISIIFIQEAKRRYGKVDNILYSKVDIDHLEFDKRVDIIIANGVLNNAKNIEYTITTLLELVNKGGKIFIIEQVEESLEMLVSQAFMMEESKDLVKKGEKTFRNIEDWLNLFNNSKIDRVEVLPKEHFMEQRLFVIQCK